MNSSLSSSIVNARPIVLVGMMGAGKTSVGKSLAKRLGMAFFDSDAVIEAAEGMTVAEIFAQRGEEAFRQAEQKTIADLLDGSPCVLSLGGGAFVNAATRDLIHQKAVSVWLKADLDMLLERALRKGKRPLLKVADPKAKMREIMVAREAIYAEADVVVESDARPVEVTAARVQQAIEDYQNSKKD